MTEYSVREVAYEAERALCKSAGCGGIPEWVMLPEKVRLGDTRPRAVPFGRPDLDELRQRLVDAVWAALA